DGVEHVVAVEVEVEHADLVARGQELRDEHRADVAGAAGDQDRRHQRSTESMLFWSAAWLTGAALPTTDTACAPTMLARKPRRSGGTARAAPSAVSASTASPAPVRSTMRGASDGLSKNPWSGR